MKPVAYGLFPSDAAARISVQPLPWMPADMGWRASWQKGSWARLEAQAAGFLTESPSSEVARFMWADMGSG